MVAFASFKYQVERTHRAFVIIESWHIQAYLNIQNIQTFTLHDCDVSSLVVVICESIMRCIVCSYSELKVEKGKNAFRTNEYEIVGIRKNYKNIICLRTLAIDIAENRAGLAIEINTWTHELRVRGDWLWICDNKNKRIQYLLIEKRKP